jgi:hypothetical protein
MTVRSNERILAQEPRPVPETYSHALQAKQTLTPVSVAVSVGTTVVGITVVLTPPTLEVGEPVGTRVLMIVVAPPLVAEVAVLATEDTASFVIT